MSAATTGRQRCRLLGPFRLRTLLVLLSLVCLACGWEADRLRRRAQAIALLNRWELWVQEEEDFNRLPWSLLPDSVCRWELPWPSTCSSVTYIPWWICGTVVPGDPPDALLESPEAPRDWNLQRPTRAERKRLVAAIATLTELPFLQVPFELDDDDLCTLSRLTELEILGFKTCGLTDAGIASIQKLHKIRYLTIDFDRPDCVPVEAIAKLGKLPFLETLSTARLPYEAITRIKAALPHVEVVVPSPCD